MKRVLLATLLMAPMAAYAQTSPNVTQGQVWTIPQWNAFLASKADTANPVFTGTINGAAAALSGALTVGTTLGVTGAATLVGGPGRARTRSAGPPSVQIKAANNNPIFVRNLFELANQSVPRNAVEMTLLGYSGNTITLSGTQTYNLLKGSAIISGSTTTDTPVYLLTTQENYSTAGAPN